MRTPRTFLMAWLAVAAATCGARASAKDEPAPEVPLTEVGRKLEAEYAAQLEGLRNGLLASLPSLDEARQSAYLEARETEAAAEEAVEQAKKQMGELGTAQALVGHAKGKWIGGAEKGIAEAKARRAKAGSEAEVRAAEEDLAKWEQNKRDGLAALAERQAALEEAQRERPAVEKQFKDAEAALEQARRATMTSMRELGVAPLLSSDALDARLAGHAILKEATPRGLAAFAQQGEALKELVDLMFADGELLVRMAVADGANGGRYGRAMEIYRDIRNASERSHEGALERLALAIALEHAVPVALRNAVADADAPSTADPVQRYLHYEKAFLGGELDPAFGRLSVWDYRMVVNGEEPDEILAWGREMLRNYRPDQVTKPDYRWRYVEIVRSDVRYGSQDNHYDEDHLQFFQNILKNGGVCGRRAFFGRFILRAFGIPTTARPQRGHAALVHWTPDGWVPCLGAGWGSGWTKTRYGQDLDFLATTQARATGEAFMRVKRAQWIGDLMGESPVHGFAGGKPGFWYGLALHTQRALIEASKAKALDAVGQDIAEANETKEVIELTDVVVSEDERRIRTEDDGTIVIPAAATLAPTRSTGKILFMDSALGGTQLHYGRNGGPQEFEYAVDVPNAGRYALTARVVTPSWQQKLLLTLNGETTADPVVIPLPFTVGRWESTEPVEIELAKGRNTLRFTHGSDGQAKGFSIREFTLSPR